jgi:hypothetical protein
MTSTISFEKVNVVFGIQFNLQADACPSSRDIVFLPPLFHA